MLNNLKLRYSLISFLSLLTVLTLEAPVLGSYSQENKSFIKEELEFFWKEDMAGFSIFYQEDWEKVLVPQFLICLTLSY